MLTNPVPPWRLNVLACTAAQPSYEDPELTYAQADQATTVPLAEHVYQYQGDANAAEDGNVFAEHVYQYQPAEEDETYANPSDTAA